MANRSAWNEAAEGAGRTLFVASFFPSAALAVLVLTQTLAMARDVLFDGTVLLTVSALATGILLAVGRQREGRSAFRWYGMAFLSVAAQVAVAFGIALIWVAVARPNSSRSATRPGKSHRHGRSAPVR